MTETEQEAPDAEFSVRVARNIRAELARREWSQGQLAAAAGYSAGALSRRLKGGDSLTVRDLDRIATALNIPPSDFFHA